jgi:tight adherence protein B
MDETTLFYVLIFVSTVLLTLTFSSAFLRPLANQKRINRRLGLLDTGVNGTAAVELLKAERWMTGGDYRTHLGPLRTLLVQSGVRAAPQTILASLVCLVLVAVIGTWLVTADTAMSLLVAVIALAVVPWLYLHTVRRKRIQKFSSQLPDVIDLTVRSLRAGHPLPVAFSLAAREMPDPAGTEFGIAADEIAFGSTTAAAMANLSYRVGDPDLDYLTTCIAVQGQTGGSLGEVLSRLSKLMRDRFRLARKVKAMTSEARTSGLILSLFPFILFGLLIVLSPTYYQDVWHLSSFHRTLIYCGGLLLIGHLVMQRMANIKY